MSVLLGCIADDFTGASDLALMLAERGMATTQVLNMAGEVDLGHSNAVVIALKTRTSSVENAVRESLASSDWLLDKGASQLFFKYCSTFDSTSQGNIGPVADVLLERVEQDITVVCPAFPETGRTIRNGNLYVNGQLLAESPMRNHPLTPMRESSLLKMMDAQTRPGSSGLISLETVRSGSPAVKESIEKLKSDGIRYAVTDIETNSDLEVVGQACKGMRLVTGAAGIALGLVPNFDGFAGVAESACEPLPKLPGFPLVLSGSCSVATRKQVEVMRAEHFSIEVNPFDIASGDQSAEHIGRQVADAWQEGPVLVFACSDPQEVLKAQGELGREQSALMIEKTLAEVAQKLAGLGCHKFIVAGGETSGAVAQSLGVNALKTGPRIAPGVPWMIRADGQNQVMAFKSGNFGAGTFFLDAMDMLP
ncbi:MAG TPA: 3-oxo-tetronate kinase [Xanthomonadales bacterium]|nr:3-oxo-tetronate kinase [Xanthomonadales bacterium]